MTQDAENRRARTGVPDAGIHRGEQSLDENGFWHFLKADPSFKTKLILLACLVGVGVVGLVLASTVPAEDNQDAARVWVGTVTGLLMVGIIGVALLGSIRRQAAASQAKERAGRTTDGVARRLLSESLAMLDYALSKGLDVDSNDLQTVFEAQQSFRPTPHDTTDTSGSTISAPTITPAMVKRLADTRQRLVQVVRPATPSTLELLQTGERSALFEPLGRVRLIRHMLYVAVVFLLAALAIIIAADPLSEAMPTASTASEGVANPILGDGWVDRLWNSLFLVVVAGLGAAFFALYTATRYVKQNSYDEQYEPTYWIRFVLGLVGGFTLALLIGDEFLGDNSIGIPLLSFIGGFSADVVQRVLQRVVDTVDALIRGSSDARIDQWQRDIQSQAAIDTAGQQMKLAVPLLALENRLTEDMSSEEMRAEVRRVVKEVLPIDASAPDPGVPHEPDGVANDAPPAAEDEPGQPEPEG